MLQRTAPRSFDPRSTGERPGRWARRCALVVALAVGLAAPAAASADDSADTGAPTTDTDTPDGAGEPTVIDGDGYLGAPDKPEPNGASTADPGPAAASTMPSGAGITLGLGVQIPTGGDLRGLGNDREMYGSGNLSFGLVATPVHFIQWEFFSIRGGFGGLDPDYYERLTGFEEMSSHHIWFGTHARIEVVPVGPIRPFVSGFFGADRIAATASTGTGAYICEEGFFGGVRCEEETARELAIGYWGWSGGVGGGVRIPRLVKPLGMIVEGWAAYANYGRFTSSEFANVRLRDDARRVWSAGGHIAIQLLTP